MEPKIPPSQPENQVRNHLSGTIQTLQTLAASGIPAHIVTAAHLLASRIAAGGKILLCGNGGSAADCQHIAAEFTGRLRSSLKRPGIPAIALTTDTSFLTARANDCGFDTVFERLLQALGRPGDALIAISTSGASENVIRAARFAREQDIVIIALLGGTGGALAGLADVPVVVPSASTQHIQEAHIAIGHILCELVEETLYGSLPRP